MRRFIRGLEPAETARDKIFSAPARYGNSQAINRAGRFPRSIPHGSPMSCRRGRGSSSIVVVTTDAIEKLLEWTTSSLAPPGITSSTVPPLSTSSFESPPIQSSSGPPSIRSPPPFRTDGHRPRCPGCRPRPPPLDDEVSTRERHEAICPGEEIGWHSRHRSSVVSPPLLLAT